MVLGGHHRVKLRFSKKNCILVKGVKSIGWEVGTNPIQILANLSNKMFNFYEKNHTIYYIQYSKIKYALTLRDLGSRRRFITWGGGAPPLKIGKNALIGLKFFKMVYSTTINKYAKKKNRKSQFNPMMTPPKPPFLGDFTRN